MGIIYSFIYLLIGWFSGIGFQVCLAQANHVAGDEHSLSIFLLLPSRTWDYSACNIWLLSSTFLI